MYLSDLTEFTELLTVKASIEQETECFGGGGGTSGCFVRCVWPIHDVITSQDGKPSFYYFTNFTNKFHFAVFTFEIL